MMNCSCCGEPRGALAALECVAEVKVCGGCLEWLRGQLGIMDVTPILPTLDIAASAAFYEAVGFHVRVYADENGGEDGEEDGGYAFVQYEDASVFDLTLAASAAGAGCYIRVPNVDEWHTRLTGLGHSVTPIVDEPWGMREFALTDPSGNRLRFGHDAAC